MTRAKTQSELALGTWAFGGNAGFWTDQERSASIRTLHLAVRSGVRSYDTAYAYQKGRAEQMLGQQLKRFPLRREDLFLSTKTTGRDNLRESLGRLCTDYVDIWYLHWPSSRRDVRSLIDGMKRHPEAKKIGICNVTVPYLEKMDLPIDAVQIPCSLLWTRGMDEMVAWCRSRRIFLSGYSPVGLGTLSGRHDSPPPDSRADLYCYRSPKEFGALLSALREIAKAKGCSMSQVAVSWARSAGFDQVVLGSRTKEQLREDLASPPLTDGEWATLKEKADALSASAPAEMDNVFGHRW